LGRVIAVVNQKGGVGKTTTAINLGACLADLGRRVLLVDMDPQGNSTSGLGINKSSLSATIYDCLADSHPLGSATIETSVPGLWIVPATVDLAGAEVELVSALARESRLKGCLGPSAGSYDYVLLDSPPSLGLLTVNCLAAAESVIIPVQCEFYALEGLTQLRNTLSLVAKMLNPGLQIFGVVLTMFDSRTRLSSEVADEVRQHFGGRVFRSVIPRNVRLSEAPIYGQPVVRYAPGSRGADAYIALAREVVEIGEPQGSQVIDTDGNAVGAGDGSPGGAGGPVVAEPVPAEDEGGRRGDAGASEVDQDARDHPAADSPEAGEPPGVDSRGEAAGGGEAGGATSGSGGDAGGERPGDAGVGAGGEPPAGGH
jgi:chromosome partitioning protein